MILDKSQLVLFGKDLGDICSGTLTYPSPKSWILNYVISDISGVLRETTLIISIFMETVLPVETE